MLEPVDGLQTLAEIAITLAGFSGLVAAFSATNTWGRVEKTRFLNILILCFIVVLCAMLPIFAAPYFADASYAWRVSCFLFGAVQLSIVARFIIAVLGNSWKPEMPWLSVPIAFLSIVVGVAGLCAAIANIPQANAHLLGLILIWGIVAASIQFILSLRSAWSQNATDV